MRPSGRFSTYIMNIKEMITPGTGIAEYNATAAALEELRARLSGVAYDVSTGKGMEVARRDRAEVRDLRVALEKKRVELKAPALERSRLIDAEAKRITAELLELEGPIDEQIKAEEQRKEADKQAKILAEFGRVQAIQDAIAEIHMDAMAVVGKGSAVIRSRMEEMSNRVLDTKVFQESMAQAQEALRSAVGKLETALSAALHTEAEADRVAAERAELEQLRAQAAEQKRKDEAAAVEARKAEDARLAAERAAAQAEQRRLDAEAAAARAEADRIAAAERKAAQEAHEIAMAEQRAAVEVAQKAEAEKRAKAEAKRLKAEAAEKKMRDAAPLLLSALRAIYDKHNAETMEQARAAIEAAT